MNALLHVFWFLLIHCEIGLFDEYNQALFHQATIVYKKSDTSATTIVSLVLTEMRCLLESSIRDHRKSLAIASLPQVVDSNLSPVNHHRQ